MLPHCSHDPSPASTSNVAFHVLNSNIQYACVSHQETVIPLVGNRVLDVSLSAGNICGMNFKSDIHTLECTYTYSGAWSMPAIQFLN